MEGTPKVFPPKVAESMRDTAEEMLQDVMQSVNEAADGDWISGSEEQVRDRFAVFREQMFQAALQMKEQLRGSHTTIGVRGPGRRVSDDGRRL